MSKKKASKKNRVFENLLKTTREFAQGKQYSVRSKSALREKLQISEDHYALFDDVLDALLNEGILCEKEGEYHRVVVGEKKNLIRGTVAVHIRGFGFVNQPSPLEDVFIPKNCMNGAIDGDVVEISVQPSAKGPEGEVVHIVERKRDTLAGTVVQTSSAFIDVYSTVLGESNLVKCPITKEMKVSVGDRIILKVQKWGKGPEKCSISQILGHISDASIDTDFSILENRLRVDFPEEALEEAGKYSRRVSSAEIEKREDLRHLECVTIDPDTAKDFDDAISIEKIDAGFRLGVHIADVSYYVSQGSFLDKEARLRCNSTYFPNTCIPMLPRELSENLCSLRPNVNRLTVSVFITLNEHGETLSWNIVRGVIRSRKRFTYKEAKTVLDGKKDHPYKPLLERMVEVCSLLKRIRAKRGSVELYMPELRVVVDKGGVPEKMELIEYDITHQMIEEFMLKANEIVAIHLNNRGRDLSYRVHESPADESLRDFAVLVSAFGFSLPDQPSPHDIQKFFVEVQDSPHASYLALCYIKSMRMACYSPDNIGHYGLSLEHYCHFTSPIRRYVDLVVHRLLFEDAIDPKSLSEVCSDASERERISARAEGSVRMMKKLRLLQEKIKKDPKAVYEATITRVKPFGIYFDVLDFLHEGFLHISDLTDDFFIFDDVKNQLNGRRTGRFYCCGEKVHVRCLSIDLLMQEARWRLDSSKA